MNPISFKNEADCVAFLNRNRKSLHKPQGGFNDGLRFMGYTHQVLKGADGAVKMDRYVPNLITTVGKAAVAGLILTDVAGTLFDYMAIGTGTTAAAAGDTTLQTEITTNGGARVAGTGTRVTTTTTNDTAQLVASWTFSGSFAITEAGILNASSSGTLLARQVFSAVNVVSGDSFQITWKIALS